MATKGFWSHVQCGRGSQKRYCNMRVWLPAFWLLPALLSAGCANPVVTSRSSAGSQAWLAASGLDSGRVTRHVRSTKSGFSVASTSGKALTSGSGDAHPPVGITTLTSDESKEPRARQVSHRVDTLTSYPQSAPRSATTPKIGSPEWEREQAENERRERHIRNVLQSICRGC